jgi:hypothetical protein
MKVEILNYNESQITLPRIAFLKLYGRRYLDECGANGKEPWDCKKESLIKEIDQKIRLHLPEPENIIRGASLPSLVHTGRRVIVYETSHFDGDDYAQELKSLDSADADAVRQWTIEMRYRYDTASWFRTECRAYNRLRPPLQGICVPIFYGATLFDETSELLSGVCAGNPT